MKTIFFYTELLNENFYGKNLLPLDFYLLPPKENCPPNPLWGQCSLHSCCVVFAAP